MAMRFLILNDGIDTDDFYCFENGDRYDNESAIEVLSCPHDGYDYAFASYSEIEEAFAQAHEDFDADDVEGIVTNLFDHVMHEYDVDYENVYLPAFNEIWELASNL